MDADTIRSEVLDFLDTYIRAFSPGSGRRIADLFHTPCLLVRGDQTVHALTSDGQVEAFFQPVAETLWSAGTVTWAVGDVSIEAVGGRNAHVLLTWTPLRADGSAIRSWRQAYDLIQMDGEWRILMSTILIEAAA